MKIKGAFYVLFLMSIITFHNECKAKSSDEYTTGNTLEASWPMIAVKDIPTKPVIFQTITPELIIDDKMDTYIRCYNLLDNGIYNVMKIYANWLTGIKSGPNGDEIIVNGIGLVSKNTLATCQEEIVRVENLQAPLEPIDDPLIRYITLLKPVDDSAKVFMQSAEGLIIVIDSMNKYYEKGEYHTDQFRKGKELHLQLIDKLRVFSNSSQIFHNRIDKLNEERQFAKLHILESRGESSMGYYALAIVFLGNKINREILKENIQTEKLEPLSLQLQTMIDKIAQLKKTAVLSEDETSAFIHRAEEYQDFVIKTIKTFKSSVMLTDEEKVLRLNLFSTFSKQSLISNNKEIYNKVVMEYNKLH